MASQPKKKKRRLRWQIRLFLALFCVASVGFLLYMILSGLNAVEEQAGNPVSTADAALESNNQNSPILLEKDIKILIDAGHGGFDPGNVSVEGYEEADINLNLALAAADYLEHMNDQFDVVLVRDSDTVNWADNELDDLTYREQLQSKLNADYYISIHCNSYIDPVVSGYSFYIKPDDKYALDLTESIAQSLEEISWSQNLGVLYTDANPLQVISESKIPAVLLEVGYMTNPVELQSLLSAGTQESLGKAIAQGIGNFVQKTDYKSSAKYLTKSSENKDSDSSKQDSDTEGNTNSDQKTGN